MIKVTTNTIIDVTEYYNDNLHVTIYDNLLTSGSPGTTAPDTCRDLYQYLEDNVVYKAKTSYRRCSQTYGDGGTYDIVFRGVHVARPIHPWLPPLLKVKKVLEQLTDTSYNVCVVQRYPTGKIGIPPHRDKEMVKGTSICGVSLGVQRVLTMSRGTTNINIPLPVGSAYVLHPPTNTYWTHCIQPDPSITQPRISLTFRNYEPTKQK